MSFGPKKAPAAPNVPPPVAVQGEASPTIDAARRAAMRKAQGRRGFQSTIRAGETFSGTSYGSNVGQRSLLGLN